MVSQMSLGQVGSPQPCQHEVILPLGISCPLNTNWRHPRPFPSPWALELTKYLRQSLPGSARPCPSGPPPQTAQIVTIFCSEGAVSPQAYVVAALSAAGKPAFLKSGSYTFHPAPSLSGFGGTIAETETCWPEGVLVHSLLKERMLQVAKPTVFEDTVSR